MRRRRIGINKENITANKLYTALRQLHKTQWKQSIEGNKPSEMTLMLCIAKRTEQGKEGLKVSEISRFLSLTPPTVTQHINSLEGKGMVERTSDPTDRRVVRVRLTDKGMALTERAKAYMDSVFAELIQYLGEEESEQLAELILKVKQFIQEHPPLELDRLEMNGDEKLD